MSFLYKADPVRGAEWARLFALHAPDIPFLMWPHAADLSAVRYLAAWEPPSAIHDCLPNLEVLFCTGAGIDHIDLNAVPPSVAVVRMIESGIAEGMVDYVTLATLALHRDFFTYVKQKQTHEWRAHAFPTARRRRVGVMGLGVLGNAVLARLLFMGFDCAGWSRSPHTLTDVPCYAGPDGLPRFLQRTDILICLLPLTPETRGVLNSALFEQLADGAALVNVARGGHLVEADLLAALDSGKLSNAVVDVTATEPLPTAHPFWEHPRIMVTPHIASMTQPDSAVAAVLENLRLHREGHPMNGLVDRRRGY